MNQQYAKIQKISKVNDKINRVDSAIEKRIQRNEKVTQQINTILDSSITYYEQIIRNIKE